MLGVYGTVAYTVARRTFDIGMRMALGAEKGRIMREVSVGAAKLGAWGVVVGVVLSLMMVQLVRSMLVGVGTSDPVSLGGAVGVLMLTVVVAAFVPGWRATRVNPMGALRME
jgi:ABC-type antimicrobial peptide transport system permease subunit